MREEVEREERARSRRAAALLDGVREERDALVEKVGGLQAAVSAQHEASRRREVATHAQLETLSVQLEALQQENGALRRDRTEIVEKFRSSEQLADGLELDAATWRNQTSLLEQENVALKKDMAKLSEQAQLAEWNLRRWTELEQKPPVMAGMRVSSAQALLASFRKRRPSVEAAPKPDFGDSADDTTDVPRTDADRQMGEMGESTDGTTPSTSPKGELTERLLAEIDLAVPPVTRSPRKCRSRRASPFLYNRA